MPLNEIKILRIVKISCIKQVLLCKSKKFRQRIFKKIDKQVHNSYIIVLTTIRGTIEIARYVIEHVSVNIKNWNANIQKN